MLSDKFKKYNTRLEQGTYEKVEQPEGPAKLSVRMTNQEHQKAAAPLLENNTYQNRVSSAYTSQAVKNADSKQNYGGDFTKPLKPILKTTTHVRSNHYY